MALKATRSVRTIPTESRLSSSTAMSSSISVTPAEFVSIVAHPLALVAAQNR